MYQFILRTNYLFPSVTCLQQAQYFCNDVSVTCFLECSMYNDFQYSLRPEIVGGAVFYFSFTKTPHDFKFFCNRVQKQVILFLAFLASAAPRRPRAAAPWREGVRAAAVRGSALSRGGLPAAGRFPFPCPGDLIELADGRLEQGRAGGGRRSGVARPRRWRELERGSKEPPENRSASAVLVAATPRRGGDTVRLAEHWTNQDL